MKALDLNAELDDLSVESSNLEIVVEVPGGFMGGTTYSVKGLRWEYDKKRVVIELDDD